MPPEVCFVVVILLTLCNLRLEILLAYGYRCDPININTNVSTASKCLITIVTDFHRISDSCVQNSSMCLCVSMNDHLHLTGLAEPQVLN